MSARPAKGRAAGPKARATVKPASRTAAAKPRKGGSAPARAATEPRSNASGEAAPRRRLSREEALELILAATEERLRAFGPDALRIQEIAEDVGMSHPTVLHHVGSRDELIHEVVKRAILGLEAELLEVFTRQAGRPEITGTLEQIDAVLRVRGQARLLAWLALTQPGSGEGDADSRLRDLALALHAARAADAPDAPFEDTAFAVILTSAAMFGAAILGPTLFATTGLRNDEASLARFRAWFAELLTEHAARVDAAHRGAGG